MENMGAACIRRICPLFLVAATVWGQYKADKAGPPPAEVAPGIVSVLNEAGFQITHNGAPYCEVWFRTKLPSGPASHEQNVTLPNVPVGALLGLIRFDGHGLDRRGQTIQPGAYTLRYGIMPMNGNHEGAAPQRDFLLMTPVAEDRDANALPNFDALVAMSRKASHTPHPAVLSFWKADTDSPGFSQQGDTDWVLETRVGDTPIDVILVGTASS
jgi:hypothetical protein